MRGPDEEVKLKSKPRKSSLATAAGISVGEPSGTPALPWLGSLSTE
jgi:hypothetical protein